MTKIDVAPGIDDADHRFAGPIGGVIAALAQPRAVAERAQVVDTEPAVAAQVLRTFTFCHTETVRSNRWVTQSTGWRRGRLFPTWRSHWRETCRNRPASPGPQCHRGP